MSRQRSVVGLIVAGFLASGAATSQQLVDCLKVSAFAVNQAAVAAAPTAVLPTGIPAPSFGLVETVQQLHGSAKAATHVIDNGRACSDSNNPKGTQASPRCTFPSMTSLPAGAVVQVRGGPYDLTANLAIGGTGTAGESDHRDDAGNGERRLEPERGARGAIGRVCTQSSRASRSSIRTRPCRSAAATMYSGAIG